MRRTAVKRMFELDFYDNKVAMSAAKRASSLPLHKFKSWYDSGSLTEENIIESSRYVHEELPLRLAKTITSFENLPLIILKQPAMYTAFRLYNESFELFTGMDSPKTYEDAMAFTLAMDARAKETADLLSILSEGLAQTRGKLSHTEVERLDEFTHLFIGHRLARRMLAANHLAIADHHNDFVNTGHLTASEVGIFHRDAPVKAIIQASAEEAQGLCMDEYGQYPEMEIIDPNRTTLFCVPANLQAVLVEVLKNSMKATVERHMTKQILPQVEATVSTSVEGCVYIQLEDCGGGMTSQSEASLWRYGISGTTLLDKKGKRTTPDPGESVFGIRDVHTKRLSGYGFGLPLSKARANYFGGELWIRNMENYGIDTYIKMPPATDRWHA